MLTPTGWRCDVPLAISNLIRAQVKKVNSAETFRQTVAFRQTSRKAKILTRNS